tara:strand:+ start:1091 stop:1288 length:198 start_codon:yes stop_codon:yes gene_type:complete
MDSRKVILVKKFLPRIFLISFSVFLFSCGGGSSVASNTQQQSTQQQNAEPETITFKNVPESLSFE